MSIFSEKRLNIFIGAYGSGKSEISVNAARIMKEEKPEQKVLLADLDIVNPFYRSADAARRLENLNIRVICPSYANSNVDVPALSGEMYAIFDDDNYVGVYDIGGEDLGANVLGTLTGRLKGFSSNLFMVVNTLRPFTSAPEQIAEMTALLESSAKMRISGYINNTNLLSETTPDSIIDGDAMILEASKLTGCPLLATTIMADLYDEMEQKNMLSNLHGELVRLNQSIRYDY